MKLIYSFFLLLVISFGFHNTSYAQTLADITGDIDQYGVHIPGIACKTRTNNEASVRNLAHGVWNRDSDAPVALNCGWPAPKPWVSRNFANNAKIVGEIYARFVRSAGTPLATANETTCTISVSRGPDDAQNPNVNGVTLGSIEPTFSGAVGSNENSADGLSTNGIAYPPASNTDYFMSAFCLLPRGVRLQFIVMNPIAVESY